MELVYCTILVWSNLPQHVSGRLFPGKVLNNLSNLLYLKKSHFTQWKCSDCKKYTTNVEKYIQISILWSCIFWFCRFISRNLSGCFRLNLYTIKLAFLGLNLVLVKVFHGQIHSLIFTNPVKSWVDHDLIPHSSLFLFLNPSYWTAFGYNKIIFSENSISKSLKKLNQFSVLGQFSERPLFLAFMAFMNSMIHEIAHMTWARKPLWIINYDKAFKP